MKSLKFSLALLFVFLPLFASAQTIPAFPMALWGGITINGNAAPVGTIVRAYYGSSLAGQVTVQDAGIYGYTEPTKQKLLVGEGSSTIMFTVQSSAFNNGTETGGTTAVTYSQFTAGSTVNDDLAFTISVPTPSSGGGNSGGSGGGGSPPSSGGGGGGYAVIPTTPASVATTTSTTTITIPTSQPVTIGVVLGASTFNFTQNLQLGSNGGDVTPLQNVLIAEGFLNNAATGYFGVLTKAALKLYQAKYGISQTGTVGPLTRAQLNKNTTSTTTTTVTTTTSTTSTYVFTQNLSLGSHASDVAPLQNVLINLGLLNSKATGYYGALTKSAVIAYQTKFGISQTGTVGPLTRAQLNK